jgi:hypothetical protein
MSVSQALKQRWNSERLDKHPLAAMVRKHFHGVLDVRDKIEAKRSELAADKTLSDLGRRQKLTELAKGEAKHVAKAQRAFAVARDKMRDQRRALMPTVKDKANVAAASLRQEIRAAMKGLPRADIAALVNDPTTDSIVLEALFEGPTILTGLDPTTRDQLLEMAVERTAGPALVALQEQDEALELLNAANRVAAETLRTAVDVHPDAFDQWLAEVAPVDPKEAAAEAAKINRDALATSAAALPLAERTSLIDQLLATNVAEIKAA